ncbi:MAG: SDR family NAD(P)-dependent oxidoreductase [Verrucomicrobiota bacterium]
MIAIDLSGKIALVTGASGELGRVMTQVLAEAGADVAIHYHQNRTGAEQVAAAVQKLGRRACLLTGDVGDPAAVAAMQRDVARELGAPDVVVTNAVSQYAWKTVLEQPIDDYDAQYRACVRQNVLLAQAFAPAMIEKKWGRIVAISTECVMQAAPTQSAYVAGKKGMDGLLRVLAKEIGAHGVTVNEVAPGWTISARDRAAGTEKQADYESKVPLRRRGEDREIAHVVAFLASDLASFITGAYVPVCGGNVMPAV